MTQSRLAECIECVEKISLVVLPVAIVAGFWCRASYPDSPLWIVLFTIAGTILAMWTIVLLGSYLAVLMTCRKIGGNAISRRDRTCRRLRYLVFVIVGIATLYLAAFVVTGMAARLGIVGGTLILIVAGAVACRYLRRRRNPLERRST
jgi:hypothetical protein